LWIRFVEFSTGCREAADLNAMKHNGISAVYKKSSFKIGVDEHDRDM